jgi:hypothetical protein
LRAFLNELPFEFRQCRKDMEGQLATRRRRVDSLWPGIVAHAIANLLLGVHVLTTGEWRWW